MTLENNEITLDSSGSSAVDNEDFICFPYKIDFSKFSKLQVVYTQLSPAAASTHIISGYLYEDFAQFDNRYLQAQTHQNVYPREVIKFNEGVATNTSNIIRDITYKGVGVLVVMFYEHANCKFKITNIHLFN